MWNAPRTLKVRGEVWRRGRRGHALRRSQRKQRGNPGRGAGCSTSGPARRPAEPSAAGLPAGREAEPSRHRARTPGGDQPQSHRAARSVLPPSFSHPARKSRQQTAGESAISKWTSFPKRAQTLRVRLSERGEPSAAKSTFSNPDALRAALPGPRLSSPPISGGSAPPRAGPGRLPAAPAPRGAPREAYLPAEPPRASSLSRTPLCFAPRSSPLDFQTSFTILIISGKSQARVPC